MSASEKTRLLFQHSENDESVKENSARPLQSLFEQPASTAQIRPEFSTSLSEDLVPIIDHDELPTEENFSGSASSSCVNRSCVATTMMGSCVFLIYHVVFCLAQAATITQRRVAASANDNDMNNNLTGLVAKTAALGVLTAGPVFIAELGSFIPAIYPASDLFLAPFLAEMAEVIDTVLTEKGKDDDNSLFLSTFVAVSSISFFLSGVLCITAARFKLANLGLFLPYPVLCGFFTTIGILMWTLGFNVDTGKKVGDVFHRGILKGDTSILVPALIHHLPSIGVGVVMHLAGRHHSYWVVFCIVATVLGSYIIMWATGTTLVEATEQNWFFSVRQLVPPPNDDNSPVKCKLYEAPLPFGLWPSLIRRQVDLDAIVASVPQIISLVILYLIRCSLHSAALKKNIPNVTRKPSENLEKFQDKNSKMEGNYGYYPMSARAKRNCSPKKRKATLTLNMILERGYGYTQLVSAVIGGIPIAPSVAASLTLFHLGAESVPPQYGSCLGMIVFYITDFRFVQYIPKPAFSCLMVLASIDMCRNWIVGSYFKTKDKVEWMVAPALVILAFSVGVLTAILLGICVSTFIFAANFYRAGTIKFVGTGLTLRSVVERGPNESAWLDNNADLIQILVMQHYLFFGNIQSVSLYIMTMFEDDDIDESSSSNDKVLKNIPENDSEYTLPPKPKYLILDFTMVTGMDTSAVDLFREITSLCKENRCNLLCAGLSPSLRAMLIYAGIKPEAKGNSGRGRFIFLPDLETALARAEDGLISNDFHWEEKDVLETSLRQQQHRNSDADDGFLYSLQKIDEQHGLHTKKELANLREYAVPVEMRAGDILVRDGDQHGLYFVETGSLRVQPTAGHSTLTSSGIANFSRDQSNQQIRSAQTSTIGHLRARTGTLGRQATIWKEQAMNEQAEQTFRLARIGQGWVIGSIEASNGMQRPGAHVAVSDCRLHFVPYTVIKEMEDINPSLALHLYKLISLLATKRQEATIHQLAQFVKIMSNPIPRLRGGKKELAKISLQHI